MNAWTVVTVSASNDLDFIYQVMRWARAQAKAHMNNLSDLYWSIYKVAETRFVMLSDEDIY